MIDDLGYLNELEIIRGIDILGIVVLNAIKSMPKWNMTKNYMYMTKKPGSYILPVLFKIIEKE